MIIQCYRSENNLNFDCNVFNESNLLRHPKTFTPFVEVGSLQVLKGLPDGARVKFTN